MTYRPKTQAEWLFRWSVRSARRGNRRQRLKKHDWYDDGWWYAGLTRRRRSLDREHEQEMRDGLE